MSNRAKSTTQRNTIARLVERDGNKCWYCGSEFSAINPPTVEHLGDSYKRYGNTRLDLEVAACYLCNHLRNHFGNLMRVLDPPKKVVYSSGNAVLEDDWKRQLAQLNWNG